MPYIIALDHKNKSVVVAIRGSASTEDFVTDFMGEPEDAGPWIPDGFREAPTPPPPTPPPARPPQRRFTTLPLPAVQEGQCTVSK